MLSGRFYQDMAKSFHQFEVAGGVLAPGADEVGGELVAFIDVAADLADPLLLATLGGCSGGLGLDVLLVVGVGDAGAVAQHAGLHRHGDEHGVGAEVDALGDNTTNHAVDELGQVKQTVLCAEFCLAFGEFVHVAPALEAEVLERLHGGLLAEGAEVELQRAEYHVVRQVGLVDAYHELQRVAGDLLGHIDDACVIFLALTSHEHKESVADIEDGFVVDHDVMVIGYGVLVIEWRQWRRPA